MKTYFTRLLVIAILSVCFSSISNAQYSTGIGGHIGKAALGVDVKHFFDDRKTMAFEIFAGMTQEANSGYLGKLFFIKQSSYRNSRFQFPLKVMIGVGGHAGYFKDPLYTIKDDQIVYYPNNTFSAGVDGMLGLEFNSRKIPFTIGVDATPYYSFLNPGTGWIDFGLNVRYIIP